MGICRFAAGAGVVALLSASTAFAAFSDNFNDPASSNSNWMASTEKVTRTFENGAMTVTNTDTSYANMMYHTFSAADKRELFTLSAKITLKPGARSAGFLCCLSIGSKVTGYNVSFGPDGAVSVDKVGSSAATTQLVLQRSAYLVAGTNELKISRKEGKFNLFCNGHFTATFTDTEFKSGDLGLLVDAKSAAVFDDVVMTDVFTEGAAPTCFADDFNDGNLLGWSNFGSEAAVIKVADGALRITTAGNQDVYEEVAIGLSQFVMKAVVSLHRGGIGKTYGLFIRGTAPESIPLAGFVVTGGRMYGAFISGKSYQLQSSSKVKGAPFVLAPGDTTFYKDTLQVIKRQGTPEYLFVVNNDTLSRLAGVDFAVTGVGIFCSDSLDVVFDDFIAAEGTTGACPVLPSTFSRIHPAKPGVGIAGADMRVFDLSGRLMPGNRMAANTAAKTPGLYIRSNGKVLYRRSDR
jgi:hypothetical protein